RDVVHDQCLGRFLFPRSCPADAFTVPSILSADKARDGRATERAPTGTVGLWPSNASVRYSRSDATETALSACREAILTDPVTAIDLRSDTVTRPSPAMRAAMASASVGNDEYGEDPTINHLQERTASMLGKEAALWFPSGTMANQTVLRVLTRPGDDVVVSRESHAVWHETGGSAANAGVQLTEIGAGGVFTRVEF